MREDEAVVEAEVVEAVGAAEGRAPCSMKRLCRLSLVKLMHSCGNELHCPFWLKFSKPKMSSTPTQKAAPRFEMYTLITSTHQSKASE